jgi:hypothetical protein
MREPLEAHRMIEAREADLARQRELVARRQQDLAVPEEALFQRERRIAEQRRIMNEVPPAQTTEARGHICCRGTDGPNGSAGRRQPGPG